MRLSIVLAICFLGVASASTLVKRNFFDDLQNKSQEALKNLGHFGEDFGKKVQDALSKTDFKLPDNPLGFAKQAQDFFNTVKNFNNPIELGKQLLDFFNSQKKAGASGDEKSTTRQTTNPLQLLTQLGDPAAFAQTLMKILSEMAFEGRRKRDLAEDLKKFAEEGKQRAQEALKQLQDLFNSFKNGGASAETSTEKAVSKRDVSEDLQKLASAGQEKLQAALKQLQELFEQFKGGFNHDQSSETVTKRDVSESLKQFGQIAQEKTQAAFQHLKDALAQLLGKKPSQQVEDSTEVSVSKRSIEDFQKFNKNLQEQAQQALSGFKNAFADFFNQFRKPFKPEAEDTTESS
ncbi:uncharacterized protein LOC128390822 [Panonychus citri]|uniref:uncharacterized protein LOC128390822 n=1 Tax=Panonychus citri TaxID=50023 RepID=UPI00230804B1|nr:uncharacterized protein LOC128390822 [Panonychus citri]